MFSASHFYMLNSKNVYQEVTEIVLPDTITNIGKYQFTGFNNVTKVTLPNSVTSISDCAFKGCSNITSIVVPTSVTSIGYSVFKDCSSLVSITLPFVGSLKEGTNYTHFGYIFGASSYDYNLSYIPSSLNKVTILGGTSISSCAFYGCSSLTSIGIPTSVTSIGSSAFSGCSNLTSVIISTSVTSIGSSAFYGCSSLTSIVVPTSVTSIGSSAFYGCNNLISITLPFVGIKEDTNGSSYESVFGIIFGYKTSGSGGTTSANYGYTYQGNSRYYYIPESLRTIVITKQTNIPNNAFYNCDLIEEITIPENVTSIGEKTFYNCSGLKKLNSEEEGTFNIPDSVTSIIKSTFYRCSQVKKVTMGEVETIGTDAFLGCSLIEYFNSETQYKLEIPSSVTSIGDNAFNNLVLIKEVNVSDSVESIGSYAFYNCSAIEKITLPFIGYNIDSTSILSSIFNGNVLDSVKEVVITKDTKIPSGAFNGWKKIEKITIPSSVTSIGEKAFYNCSGLKKLNSEEEGTFNIPTGVTSIGTYAFSGCTQVKKVTMGDVITIGSYAFSGCSLMEYFNSETQNKLEIPSSVTSIGSYAFNNLVLIKEVNVSDSVESIGEGTFKGCNAIEKITLPFVGIKEDTNGSSYESVFGIIFGYKTSGSGGTTSANYGYTYQGYFNSYYRYYYIPETIKTIIITTQVYIPNNAFYNCDLIEEITIPESVISIGENAFYNCNATINQTYNPIISSVWDKTISDGYHSGTGTSDDPYIIFTASEFAYFEQEVNKGNKYDNTYFELSSNIRLNNQSFKTIGSLENPFNGHFNGNGYIIRDFSISSNDLYTGLFGYVNGTIENVGIKNATITSTSTGNNNYYAGAIAYLSETGAIKNIYTTGTITNTAAYYSFAGGICGYSKGLIESSYSTCNVTAKSTSLYATAGGLVGSLEGTIKNSFATGNVTATGATNVYSRNGGLVGYKDGTAEIINSYRSSSQQLTKYNTSNTEDNTEGIVDTTSNIISILSSDWSNWLFNKTLPQLKKTK